MSLRATGIAPSRPAKLARLEATGVEIGFQHKHEPVENLFVELKCP